jgi:uncharacterized protein YjbJ (UPF0337 family)
MMNKNRVKGTIDEVVGSAKRHVGRLTGNSRTEVEGGAQQLKGKVENTVGKVKDAARNARDNSTVPHEKNR